MQIFSKYKRSDSSYLLSHFQQSTPPTEYLKVQLPQLPQLVYSTKLKNKSYFSLSKVSISLVYGLQPIRSALKNAQAFLSTHFDLILNPLAESESTQHNVWRNFRIMSTSFVNNDATETCGGSTVSVAQALKLKWFLLVT